MSDKTIRADIFLSFAEDMEAAIEVLSSEIPIDSPKRQTIEVALKKLRASIDAIRGQLQ